MYPFNYMFFTKLTAYVTIYKNELPKNPAKWIGDFLKPNGTVYEDTPKGGSQSSEKPGTRDEAARNRPSYSCLLK